MNKRHGFWLGLRGRCIKTLKRFNVSPLSCGQSVFQGPSGGWAVQTGNSLRSLPDSKRFAGLSDFCFRPGPGPTARVRGRAIERERFRTGGYHA